MAQGEAVDLILLGGSVMVLVFETRQSTRDVDVVILSPANAASVRAMAKSIAAKRGWQDDWLNDAVNGFMMGLSPGREMKAQYAFDDLWDELHGSH